MFDLTPGLSVDPSQKHLYRALRALLFFLFCFFALFVTLWFIFHDEERYFDFRIYQGPRNSIANPRYPTGNPVDAGKILENQAMTFNATAIGAFSTVALTLQAKGGAPLPTGVLSVVRAYRAFLYPTGESLGFREGTPLSDGTHYFLLSEGKLRSFASWDIARQMGWQKVAFIGATPEEISQEIPGATITTPTEPVEGMLLTAENNYYQFHNQTLVPFVSTRAFLSRFQPIQALSASPALVSSYPISEERVGFLDGTLLSYGESAYVVEGAILRPIDSADTFLGKGYQWKDIIPASGEEFGYYTRGKLYTVKEPHPNGTLFSYPEKNQYFLIDHGTKREISSENVLAQFHSLAPVKVNPIPLSESCLLHPSWMHTTATCEISLAHFNDLNADEYQFVFTPTQGVTLQEMNTTFIRHINRENLHYFLNDLRVKFSTRYGGNT